MFIKNIYLLFLALSFIGCSNLNTKEYTGRYTYGHEVEIFTNEKIEQDYWLYGNVEILNQYMKKLRVSKNISYSALASVFLFFERVFKSLCKPQ